MLAKSGITLMAKSGFSLKLAHAGEIKGTCAGKISDLRPVLAECMITSDNLASKPAISSVPLGSGTYDL